MSAFVLDASAVLAVLFAETGSERAAARAEGAMMSTVNLTETLTKCAENDYPASDAVDFILNSNISVIDFDLELAKQAAALRKKTDRRVLSLGDRACLALAVREKAVAVTGDRIWATIDVGCQIEVIR
jgi:ribonuclease VapC